MKSKWFQLKSKAISLRNHGKSIREIESILGIPRSTLSGWLRKVKLTPAQSQNLKERHDNALVEARKKAVIWHNQQKEKRLKLAEEEADKTLRTIDFQNTETIELALAFLYLGEGTKKSSTTGMGNSDPIILKFFLKILLHIYNINIEKVRFYLHIRADQNPQLLKEYWADELGVPIHLFKGTSADKRTIGKPSYPDYKGVCVIDCGNVAIQRKLVYIARKFSKQVINNMGG